MSRAMKAYTERARARQAKLREQGPQSLCICGHTGDGAHSDHADGLAGPLSPGHGHCTVVSCNCAKFSWAKFINGAKS